MLWTTCAAVITLPSAVTSTPEPVSLKRDWPLVVTSRPRALITTTLALTWSKTCRTVWASTVAALDMRIAIITVPASTTAINDDPWFGPVLAIIVLLSLPVPVEGVPRSPSGPDKSTTSRAGFPVLAEVSGHAGPRATENRRRPTRPGCGGLVPWPDRGDSRHAWPRRRLPQTWRQAVGSRRWDRSRTRRPRGARPESSR